jgi:hypothetical protein
LSSLTAPKNDDDLRRKRPYQPSNPFRFRIVIGFPDNFNVTNAFTRMSLGAPSFTTPKLDHIQNTPNFAQKKSLRSGGGTPSSKTILQNNESQLSHGNSSPYSRGGQRAGTRAGAALESNGSTQQPITDFKVTSDAPPQGLVERAEVVDDAGEEGGEQSESMQVDQDNAAEQQP